MGANRAGRSQRDTSVSTAVYSWLSRTGQQIEQNGTMRSIVDIRNGLRSGLKTEQKPATNCVDTPDRGCSTWAPRSSRSATFFGIATCKQHSYGTRTGYRIGSFGRSACAILSRIEPTRWERDLLHVSAMIRFIDGKEETPPGEARTTTSAY